MANASKKNPKLRLSHQRKPVHHPFGTKLLDNADHCVHNDGDEKQHLLIMTHKDQAGCQHRKYKIEKYLMMRESDVLAIIEK